MARQCAKSRHKGSVQSKSPNSNSFQTGIEGSEGGPRGCDGLRPSEALSFDLQQLLLNVFKDTFASSFSAGLPSLIQEIKQHLYNRDFLNAFGRQALLEAYAIRWSPSRALAYADIIHSSSGLLAFLSHGGKKIGRLASPVSASHHPDIPLKNHSGRQMLEPDSEHIRTTKIVCLGGGSGAEILGFAGLLSYLKGLATCKDGPLDSPSEISPVQVSLAAVDIADWSTVAHKLYGGIIGSLRRSSISSAESTASKDPPLDAGTFNVDFYQYDILNTEASQLANLFHGCGLVTLMFTLNELYSTSVAATTNLLLSMTFLLEPGTLLLVVDSPGSYSTVSVGRTAESQEKKSTQKKYPMQWLLDHTLLEAAQTRSSKQSDGEKQWEKLEESISKWFRLPQMLLYPIKLEDMRYQLHLYRRVL